MTETHPSVYSVFVVVNADGKPVGACPTIADATTFARCLGFDAPLDAIKVTPVIEFARRGELL